MKHGIRQAIETKYHGPTNSRGSRVSVVTGSGIRRSYGWDDGLNPEDNHVAAAVKLAKELGWIKHEHELVTGGSRGGYVHVILTH